MYRLGYRQASWSLTDSPCTMQQRTFLSAHRTCPRHSPGKSKFLKPLVLQNTSLSRTPCNWPIQETPCTCLAHTLCILTPSSRLCTCTSKVYPHKHSTLGLHCKPTRPLHLNSSHCIHPHPKCCRRRMPRCQRPCRLRRLACIHCQRR